MFKHITKWLERQQQSYRNCEYREGRIYALTTIIIDQEELPIDIIENDSPFAQGARAEADRIDATRAEIKNLARVVNNLADLL